MFEIGDYVINAHNGICKIEDKVMLDFSGTGSEKEYFLIVPIGEKNTKLYIPVESEKQRIRKVLEKAEAEGIINEIPEIDAVWIANDKQREQKYKEAIFSCDPRQIVGVLKCMYMRNQQRFAEGKKNTTVDERYFKLAENTLHAELAFVLGVNKDEVKELILDRIRMKEKL